jgi:hypothetical protein
MMYLNLMRDFFEYQYRRDMIDKLNVTCSNDLELPIFIDLRSKIHIRCRNIRMRSIRLMKARAIFEMLSNQSSFVRRIKRHARVKTGVKIGYRNFYYLLVCSIRNKTAIFNFLTLLASIIYAHPNRNFLFSFKKKKALTEICVLRRLKSRTFFFLPRRVYRRSRSRIRVGFVLSPTVYYSNKKQHQLMLKFFLKRLRVIRKFRSMEHLKPQYIV